MTHWSVLGDPEIAAFFSAYQASFEERDPDRAADFYTYPCLFAAELDTVRSVVAVDATACRAAVAPVIELYRRARVATGGPLDAMLDRLSPSLAVVRVHWEVRSAQAPLYDFAAAYILARGSGGWRISAIAHDEMPKLRTAARAAAVPPAQA